MVTGGHSSHDPWIELSGADNVRDLGGLPTRSGGCIRPGVLLRSGTLQELSPDAVDHLLTDLGLRTVIDLRTPAEADREGSALAGRSEVQYLALPVRADDAIRSDAVADGREMNVVDHYVSYLSGSAETIVAAARAFADPANLPAIFHCAAGKDRTGVLAAIVLDAVGVLPEAIVADYALTEQRIDAIRARLGRLETYRDMQAVIRRSGRGLSANPADMQQFLEVLQERYGGGAGFLVGNGMTASELTWLRESISCADVS